MFSPELFSSDTTVSLSLVLMWERQHILRVHFHTK